MVRNVNWRPISVSDCVCFFLDNLQYPYRLLFRTPSLEAGMCWCGQNNRYVKNPLPQIKRFAQAEGAKVALVSAKVDARLGSIQGGAQGEG